MLREPRRHFHEQLQDLERAVQDMGVAAQDLFDLALQALLGHDRAICARVVAGDDTVDAYYLQIERHIMDLFALQAPVASDMRFLLSVLRIVPELERSGDLAEHIAQRAARGLTGELTPRVRGLVEQMGRVGVEMWRMAADAYGDRDPGASERIHERDDELDDLHVSLTAELVSGALTMPVALEMSLVARFYERLGDHAVNVAKRVRYMATGLE